MEVYDKDMKSIKDNMEVLFAVEMLEYHNKNWLSGSNKSRCESKLVIIEELHKRINNLIRTQVETTKDES